MEDWVKNRIVEDNDRRLNNIGRGDELHHNAWWLLDVHRIPLQEVINLFQSQSEFRFRSSNEVEKFMQSQVMTPPRPELKPLLEVMGLSDLQVESIEYQDTIVPVGKGVSAVLYTDTGFWVTGIYQQQPVAWVVINDYMSASELAQNIYYSNVERHGSHQSLIYNPTEMVEKRWRWLKVK